MIIKILESRNRTINGAIGYNQKKEKEVIEHNDLDALLTYNEKYKSELLTIENSVDDILSFRRCLNDINSQNSRVKSPLFHVAINFPPGEEVSNETMLEIAREYMEDMGYGSQPFAVWRHFDRLHPHIHIVSTRIDRRTYKKIADNHEKIKTVQLAAKYERKYHLQQTNHSKNVKAEELVLLAKDGVKNQINAVVNRALWYRPHSMKRLNQLLANSRIKMKQSGKGFAFYVVDENGKRNGRFVQASELQAFKKFGVGVRLRLNRRSRNWQKEVIKTALNDILQPHSQENKLSYTAFIHELKRKQIYIKLHRDTSGKIHDVSFYMRHFEFSSAEIGETYNWEGLRLLVAAPRREKRTLQPTRHRPQRNAYNRGEWRNILGKLFHGTYGGDESDEDDEEKRRQIQTPQL